MATVTFSDIIAQTRMLLDEVSEKDWTEVQVQREVNNGYLDLVTSVMTTYEDFYLSTTVFDLLNGQQKYDTTDGLPDNLFKIRRIELNYDITTVPTAFRKAYPKNLTEIKYSLSDTGQGSASSPLYISEGFASTFALTFLPIPKKDSLLGGKLWFIPEVNNMTDPTDVPNLPYADRYANSASKYAAGMLLRKGQQEEAVAARYLAEFDQDRLQMQAQMEDWVADESKQIQDSLAQSLDFTRW